MENLMERFCEQLISRYFDAALKEAVATKGRDLEAIASVANVGGDLKKRTADLASWLRLYRVHRVRWEALDDNIDQTFADAVARASLEHFDRKHNNLHNIPEAFKDLRDVIATCYMDNSQKDRKFMSLTGKILWCALLDRAPIYDIFASSAVINLTRIYKAYTVKSAYERSIEEKNYDSLYEGDWNSSSFSKQDSWWYRDFYCSHSTLFKVFEPSIRYRITNTKTDVSSFRVFDKFLWIFGNSDLDYSLIGHADDW
jgi:hypothetical protein